LVFSDATFAELASRVMRPKFDRYVDRSVRERFLSDLMAVAEWVSVTGALRACRDPDDDRFLETALNSAGDCIVTGDADLLALDPFRRLRILTPRAFLELVWDTDQAGPGGPCRATGRGRTGRSCRRSRGCPSRSSCRG
jgi:uncharacterized protein